jgi:hypothetical protein
VNGKALCFICSEIIVVLEEYNIAGITIQSTKKSTSNASCSEKKKVAALKRWLE